MRTAREQISAQLSVARRQLDEQQQKCDEYDDLLDRYQVERA